MLSTRTLEDRIFAGSLPLGDIRDGYSLPTILENYSAVYESHGGDVSERDTLFIDMLTDATHTLVDENRQDDNDTRIIDPATLDLTDLDRLFDQVAAYANAEGVSERTAGEYRALAFHHCEDEQEAEFDND